MGLDLYAGTLTRYYTRNWKTVAQQSAEASGMGYQVIRPDGDDDAVTDPAILQPEMQQWSDAVSAALVMEDGQGQQPWVEDNERPYYTNKPDWCAFGVLQLYGACKQYGLPVPETISRSWDPYKDETVLRALNDPELNWSLYSSVEWWLPYEACLVFRGQSPVGAELTFGTSGLLKAELDVINSKGWNADEATILSWEHTEGYPADGHMENGVFVRDKVQATADFITAVYFVDDLGKESVIFKNYGFYTCGFNCTGKYFVFSHDGGLTILRRV